MKKFFIKFLFYFTYILIYYLTSLKLLKSYNTSILCGYTMAFIILISILIIGFLISKIIFNFAIENKKLKKINIKNFNKKNIKNNILISILFLLFYFIIFYFLFFYFSDFIFYKTSLKTGIVNSFKYITKIYYISLPIYAFEITFFEYCTFLNSIKLEILLKIKKYFIFLILALISITNFKFNGFLYTKLAIDILFLAYYIIKIREIIKLCRT